MSQPISESGQGGYVHQRTTLSKKQAIITTFVALAALAAFVIGLMAILPPSARLIPLGLRGGIACISASGITLIILITLNCTPLCRTADNALPSVQREDPMQVVCYYCLHQEREGGRRVFNFPTKTSCLNTVEQEKIDKLLSHFNENGAKLANDLQVEISSIHFLVTKFPKTGHLTLGVCLKFDCDTRDINALRYHLPTWEMDAAEIPAELPQEIEEEIRQSKILWESMHNQLNTKVTCTAIFECCKNQALKYQLEVKNLRLDKPMDVIYRADEQTMTLESFSCHYNGEWHDGQVHYQNTRPWDNNYDQWIMHLYLTVNEITSETIDNFFERFLALLEERFKGDFEHLVERTGPPQFCWEGFGNWFGGWGEESPAVGSIEGIKEALADLQEALTPGAPFTNLEVNEKNLEKIKGAIKNNFKKHALKLHPDKVGPQGEEKFKSVISLYRKIEGNYKALGLTW